MARPFTNPLLAGSFIKSSTELGQALTNNYTWSARASSGGGTVGPTPVIE